MRKPKITESLIELSKLAKKLGFPQDVEEGDWVCIVNLDGKQNILVTKKHLGSFFLDDKLHWFLILDFSTCLAWLRENNHDIHLDLSSLVEGLSGEITVGTHRICIMEFDEETHHEAICKAVVKVLEGEK